MQSLRDATTSIRPVASKPAAAIARVLVEPVDGSVPLLGPGESSGSTAAVGGVVTMSDFTVGVGSTAPGVLAVVVLVDVLVVDVLVAGSVVDEVEVVLAGVVVVPAVVTVGVSATTHRKVTDGVTLLAPGTRAACTKVMVEVESR
jgi:hypothetical protein